MIKNALLITGCCGRIGKKLIRHFKNQHPIVGLDYQEPDKADDFDFYKVDLSKDEAVNACFQQLQSKYSHFASVIHLAAYYSFSDQKSELYEKITVQGTRRLLEGLETIPTDQFIFSSTLLVYAPCKKGEKIHENSPLNPKWAYPESKVKTEKLILEKSKNIKKIILRIAGCYDDWCHSIPISQTIKRIYEKQFTAHFFPGNTSHGNPYLHFDDLTDCFDRCVKKSRELSSEEIFVIGEDITIGTSEMQNSISKHIFDKKFTTIRIPKAFAYLGALLGLGDPFIKPWMIKLADDHYQLNISKAHKVLGWSPAHRIDKELETILRYLKENPENWYKENQLK